MPLLFSMLSWMEIHHLHHRRHRSIEPVQQMHSHWRETTLTTHHHHRHQTVSQGLHQMHRMPMRRATRRANDWWYRSTNSVRKESNFRVHLAKKSDVTIDLNNAKTGRTSASFATLAERCCAGLFDVVRGRAERLSIELLPGGNVARCFEFALCIKFVQFWFMFLKYIYIYRYEIRDAKCKHTRCIDCWRRFENRFQIYWCLLFLPLKKT